MFTFRILSYPFYSLTHNIINFSGLDEEKKAESHSILLAGYLNLAMSYLKMCDNPRARDHAAKALEMDNCNVKAYFRRGQVSHILIVLFIWHSVCTGIPVCSSDVLFATRTPTLYHEAIPRHPHSSPSCTLLLMSYLSDWIFLFHVSWYQQIY